MYCHTTMGWSVRTLRMAVMCVGLCFAGVASAGDTSWNGGDGLWNEGTNWSAGVPGEGDSAYLSTAGTVEYANGSDPVLNLVSIDGGVVVQQSQDSLTALTMQVGNNVAGEFRLNAGILTLGVEGTANGNLIIGYDTGSVGTFTQLGGTATIFAGSDNQSKLILGDQAGSKGTYVLGQTGAGLNPVLTKHSNETFVGREGEGYFYQYEGTHTFAGAMYIGDSGYGRYEMYGGTLNTLPDGGGIVLGEWGGTGEFYQESGEAILSDLTLARQNNSTGKYTLTGDANLSVNGPTTVGRHGTGTFDQSGSSEHYSSELVVGDGDYWIEEPANNPGFGEYNLSGQSHLVTGTTVLGRCGGTGTFNQSGESVHETDELVVGAGADQNDVRGSGTYNLRENAVLIVNGVEIIGQAGYGVFNQYDSDTSHTIHGDLYVDAAAASKGVFNLHGGQVQVDQMVFVGVQEGATGEFNQDGGSANVNGDLVVGTWEGNTGKVNLSGGTFTASGVQVGFHGEGYLNLSNGAFLSSTWAELATNPGSTAYVTMTNDNPSSTENATVWNVGETMYLGGTSDAAGGTALLELTGAENHLRIVNSANDAGLLRVWSGGELRMRGGNGRVSIGTDILRAPGQVWVANGGTLDMCGGVVSADLIWVEEGGQLLGDGTLDVDELNVSGLLAPGHSPGILEMADDSTLYLQPTATCDMEIEGLVEGQYDLIRAAGDSLAHFDGTLVLRFNGGFSLGDMISLFEFNNYEGDFAEVYFKGLEPGLSAEFDPLTGQVTITPEPATLILVSLGGLAALRRRIRRG